MLVTFCMYRKVCMGFYTGDMNCRDSEGYECRLARDFKQNAKYIIKRVPDERILEGVGACVEEDILRLYAKK